MFETQKLTPVLASGPGVLAVRAMASLRIQKRSCQMLCTEPRSTRHQGLVVPKSGTGAVKLT